MPTICCHFIRSWACLYLYVFVVYRLVFLPLCRVFNASRTSLPMNFFLQKSADLAQHEIPVWFQLHVIEVGVPHLVEVVLRA